MNMIKFANSSPFVLTLAKAFCYDKGAAKQVEVLFQNAAVAAKKLKCPAKFERVSELRRIMAYGVMTLPALVIDGKVVAGGNVPGVEEIMQIIKQMQ